MLETRRLFVVLHLFQAWDPLSSSSLNEVLVCTLLLSDDELVVFAVLHGAHSLIGLMDEPPISLCIVTGHTVRVGCVIHSPAETWG